MGRRADDIRAYYANPYGRRPPSHNPRADSEQPVEVAGQPGLLTTELPRRTAIGGGTLFSKHHYVGGLIDLRVPLGPDWPGPVRPQWNCGISRYRPYSTTAAQSRKQAAARP